jgi:hypothetical protein
MWYRTFLVAFSDRSLVVLPIDCKDVSLCTHKVWPTVVTHLLTPDGLSAIVYAEGGHGYFVKLTETGELTSPSR